MSREIQLNVLLNAEEYMAFKVVCDDLGLAQSSRARWLIKKDIAQFAHENNIGQAELFSNDGGPLLAK